MRKRNFPVSICVIGVCIWQPIACTRPVQNLLPNSQNLIRIYAPEVMNDATILRLTSDSIFASATSIDIANLFRSVERATKTTNIISSNDKISREQIRLYRNHVGFIYSTGKVFLLEHKAQEPLVSSLLNAFISLIILSHPNSVQFCLRFHFLINAFLNWNANS